jgi:hypothetical protein
MRKLMGWLGAAALAIAVHAQDFTQTMTADERAAAGLEKLSPAELAKLKAAVERYKAGAVAIVEKQAEKKVAATEARVREAEQKVAAAEAKAQAPAEKKGPSWFGALLTLEKAASGSAKDEELAARLDGELKTFSGMRRFRLDNGQVWEMIEPGEYAGPVYRNPEVFIRPGVLGSFWLRIPDGALRVKVKPLKLQ